ncbi:hypothetical protein N7504_002406 [Penicillium tannophilum]|nr:hypothetical protein N7504_002406 [Penicillium tannophilum]
MALFSYFSSSSLPTPINPPLGDVICNGPSGKIIHDTVTSVMLAKITKDHQRKKKGTSPLSNRGLNSMTSSRQDVTEIWRFLR